MKDKLVLVTGATNGIGKVSAQTLAAQGACVIVVSRNAQKCDETVAEIKRVTGNNAVEAMPADLSSMQAVRDLARRFLDRYDHLDVLLNNAGAIYTTRTLSVDGIELTWALDHLSYFLLTNLLLGALKAASAARVVNVSSAVHQMTRNGISFDDVQGEHGYSAMNAYSQAKLANVMFTYALARRLQGTAVTTNALHPGVVSTGFGQNNTGFLGALWRFLGHFTSTPEKGAQTSIYLASSADVVGVTGKYFDNKKAVRSSSSSHDEAAQERLWQMSEKMTGS